MLEDLDSVDLVMKGEPGEVIIKIIDGGVTTDASEFDTLLKSKIAQAIRALGDDANFEAAGRPSRLRIEVVHLIPRPPYEDGAVYTIGSPAGTPRPLDVSLVFVTKSTPYNIPHEGP
jgi:hypothetical protein